MRGQSLSRLGLVAAYWLEREGSKMRLGKERCPTSDRRCVCFWSPLQNVSDSRQSACPYNRIFLNRICSTRRSRCSYRGCEHRRGKYRRGLRPANGAFYAWLWLCGESRWGWSKTKPRRTRQSFNPTPSNTAANAQRVSTYASRVVRYFSLQSILPTWIARSCAVELVVGVPPAQYRSSFVANFTRNGCF
jgi:hypothetical protein